MYSSDSDQSYPGARLRRARHRVALELEVDERPDELEPADWELSDLAAALLSGSARAVRTIRATVVDPENDRLSSTLLAMADDLDETNQMHWFAAAARWPTTVPAGRRSRPSLESMVRMDQLVAHVRLMARLMGRQGL
jgi:hypothetical protein